MDDDQPFSRAKLHGDAIHCQGIDRISPSSPTIEHFLRGGDRSNWTPTLSYFGREDSVEDDHVVHQKKSVLAKVKEKAKKWKSSLSKKKQNGNTNSTPSWGVSLEDDDDEDDNPEYLGAPMYESELAPQDVKETRQHPRDEHVLPEKRFSPKGVPNTLQEDPPLAKNSANALAYDGMVSNIHNLSVSIPGASTSVSTMALPVPPSTAPASVRLIKTEIVAREAAVDAPIQAGEETNGVTGSPNSENERIWDKGISVREYIMQKLEPGEDEKALCQVISEAISPKKNTGGESVMEKVKGVVTSLLQNDGSQHASSNRATETSKSNVEENQSIKLQEN